MPLTITTRERTLILGGPDDEPELYDLAADPGEKNNAWRGLDAEGQVLCERTLSFLEGVGTPEAYLAPRWQGARRVAESGQRLKVQIEQTIEAKTAARQ
jgi:hypothetical protein